MQVLMFENFINEKEESGDYLFFNGNYLKFIENGKVTRTWKAVSGRTPYHWYVDPAIWGKRYTISHSEWAKVKDEGPTPPGNYTLGTTQSRKIDNRWKTDADFVKKVLAKTTAAGIPGSNVKDTDTHEFFDNTDASKAAWGSYRWSLIPSKGTNTFGRSSFYLHGGSAPGSIGCIDLVTDSEDFAAYYKKWRERTGKKTIPLKIDYSTFDKNIPMEVDSMPYKMPPNVGKNINDWYSRTNADMIDSLKKNKILVDPSVLAKRSPGPEKAKGTESAKIVSAYLDKEFPKTKHAASVDTLDKGFVDAWADAIKAGKETFKYKGIENWTKGGSSVKR